MRHKYIVLNLILILLISILLICCSAGGGSSGGGGGDEETSFIKTIDSAGTVGEHTSMAVDGSKVYISYYDSTNGDLKFARSDDGGKTWAPGNIKTVDSTDSVGTNTSIAVNGSNVFISYCDNLHLNLKFAKSTDGGNTWDPANIKTVDSTLNVGWYTSIAVDGSNVYISYYDIVNEDLKFARSTDGGATW